MVIKFTVTFDVYVLNTTHTTGGNVVIVDVIRGVPIRCEGLRTAYIYFVYIVRTENF